MPLPVSTLLDTTRRVTDRMSDRVVAVASLARADRARRRARGLLSLPSKEGDRRMNAKLAAAPRTNSTEPRTFWDRFLGRAESRVVVEGWSAAVAWIDAWTRFGDWILVDGSAHPDLCNRLTPNSWHVLWYESVAAGDVWAMLAELRGRPDTRRILVVRKVADLAVLDTAEAATLGAQCSDYDATLLLVIEPR
jgi:hypothetical protein